MLLGPSQVNQGLTESIYSKWQRLSQHVPVASLLI